MTAKGHLTTTAAIPPANHSDVLAEVSRSGLNSLEPEEHQFQLRAANSDVRRGLAEVVRQSYSTDMDRVTRALITLINSGSSRCNNNSAGERSF
jgi:hypothetical protein